MNEDLARLRKSYELAELEEQAAAQEPLRQFEQWMAEALAAKVPEPNAMTLATVSPEGRPSTRVVLIKGVDPRGLVWYTNYNSRKGRELGGNPFAALQFHWVELE
ncbi:pyridoxine/pyridoxamine 5'-phosphate oxidase, partial [Ideonella sp.]|uniref:pyridoxine/pyridoxamine 5'-phosphate oxidase n=1 Tax=Ideonella sp. TaxID=1929293 RepID=UPI003BB78ECE